MKFETYVRVPNGTPANLEKIYLKKAIGVKPRVKTKYLIIYIYKNKKCHYAATN